MTHLKKLNAPRQWGILRKEKKYVVRPFPSGHKLELSLPILVVMRDMLHHVQSARELRHVLRQKGVLVDGKELKEIRSSIGLFDVLSLPQAKEQYRVMLGSNGKLQLSSIDAKESEMKICKVTGKRKTKGGKTQITLHDGRNFNVDEEVHVGDAVVLHLKDKKMSIVKLKKGAYVYLTGGKHSGSHGVLQEISKQNVVFEHAKNRLETLKKYVTVVGEGKPLLKLNE